MIKTADRWNTLEHAASLLSRRAGKDFDTSDLLQAILNTQPYPRLGVVLLGHQKVLRLGPEGLKEVGPLLRPVVYEVGDGYRVFVQDLLVAAVATPTSILSVDPAESGRLYNVTEPVPLSAVRIPTHAIELLAVDGEVPPPPVADRWLPNGLAQLLAAHRYLSAKGEKAPTKLLAIKYGVSGSLIRKKLESARSLEHQGALPRIAPD